MGVCTRCNFSPQDLFLKGWKLFIDKTAPPYEQVKFSLCSDCMVWWNGLTNGDKLKFQDKFEDREKYKEKLSQYWIKQRRH